MSSSKPARETPVALGLFVLSAAILTMEVLQMRILSVQLWYHHAYTVVTMALLGFAAAGTAATVWPGLTRGPLYTKLAWCSTLFGISVIAGHVLLQGTADRVISLSAEGQLSALAGFYGLLVIPYFFGGLAITLALVSGSNVHTRYFFNLVGSAVGAWVFILAISPLGGERLLVLCAGLGPVAALCFLAGALRRRTVIAAALVLAALAVVFWKADTWLEIEIGAYKRKFLQGELVDRRWTPLTRLDLYLTQADGLPKIGIVQDGAAGTIMHSAEAWKPRSLLDTHSLGYVPQMRKGQAGRGPAKVLAIGIGGGADLHAALDYGADSVLGVEINEEMVRILRDDYADFNGGVCQQPGVQVIVGEGRSTIRRLDESFDLIQISGADTYTAGSAGAFVLMESYLYTADAIDDYLDHLRPHGTLGIARFCDDPPRETLRLFGMGLLALRERGVEQPSRHAAIIRVQYSSCSVFSLDPLAAAQVDIMREADHDPTGFYSVLYVPGLEDSADTPYTRLARAIDEGREADFFDTYSFNVRPVTDDAPFFFDFYRLNGPWGSPRSSFERRFDVHFPVAPKVLVTLLAQTTFLVLLLVLLPLLLRQRRGLSNRNAGRHMVYYLGIGIGFMFLEISTIQRLVLFLGHPTYSLSVTLFCFLLFAGLGSWGSARLRSAPARGIRMSVGLLVALVLIYTMVLPAVLDSALHLTLAWRIVVAVLLLAPMNLLMGIPFPLGLGRLRKSVPELTPWAIGVNGGASVIGSVLCVIIAMETNFTVVWLAAGGAYLVAMLAETGGCLSPGAPET